MNRSEMFHNERKEYWRELIRQCDASGQMQRDWCQENGICSTSMSKWRNQIWREEEAEKEFAAAREEHCFVEIKAEQNESSDEEKGITLNRKTENRISTKQAKAIRQEVIGPHLMKPDAVIGYGKYMIGVYEDTSEQLLRKVVEVIRYA